MNLKNRLTKLEQAVQPKPTSGQVARRVEGRDAYLVADPDGSNPREVTRAELETTILFPLVILPTKARTAEEWEQRHVPAKFPSW